jgi:hypothetical protein
MVLIAGSQNHIKIRYPKNPEDMGPEDGQVSNLACIPTPQYRYLDLIIRMMQIMFSNGPRLG